MKKRLFIVTGSPGEGKTTVLLRTVDGLTAKGYAVGGMISREVRSSGTRTGFELLDVGSGAKGRLASVYQSQGPQLGKYRVDLEDLKEIGANAILQAVSRSDVIVIDEIGPMELFSQQFVQAVQKALDSSKPVVCTVHWRMKNELLENTLQENDPERYAVNRENRDCLHEILVERIEALLRHKESNKEL
jgi:nucleoside-triphosphatase